MRLLAHPDPVVLERELLSRLDAVECSSGVRRALVLVPTRRLSAHVQQRMAAARRVWLGVEVLQLNALTHRLLERPDTPSLAALSPRLQRALLVQVLEQLPENRWSRYSKRRPGAVVRVLRSLRDLREAGIEPDALGEAADGPRETDLAEVYRGYVARLSRLRRRGLADESGRVQAALTKAAAYARPFREIYVHGAYELIGSSLDLLHELDRAREVTVLAPLQPGTTVTAFAEEFARRHLLAEHAAPLLLETPADHARGDTLAALHDEDRHPDPAPADVFRLHNAQGAAAEVQFAVRQALQAVTEGCPPAEIVIAARTLEPFGAALEESLDDEGMPWTSSLATPLRRQPLVHDFLLLLEVLVERFPRRPTAELLRSRLVEWSRVLPGGGRPPGEHADAWSREARILGGLDEWADDLPRWAETPRLRGEESDEEREEALRRAGARGEQARRLGLALTALGERVAPDEQRSWADYALRLREVVETVFRAPADEAASAAREALFGLLDEMGLQDQLVPAVPKVGLSRVHGWLVDAVGETELSLRAEENGGIRVLDAMQLRGLTCRRMMLLGMNGGLFPRRPTEDPVLPDTLRERLRARTGRPLTIGSRTHQEERQLLLSLIGAATEQVHVSWQRADESGRARTPSLSLREIARLIYGRPDLARLLEDSGRISSHPGQQLRQIVDRGGLLSPVEVRLLAALESSGPQAIASLAGRFPEIEAGLHMLRATESFAPGDMSFDGRIGRAMLPDVSSVSGLETLGGCPLRYFFSRVLRVGELETEASAFEIGSREMGQRIHDLLETIYRTLDEEGLFAAGDLAPLRKRSRELLEPAAGTIAGELGARIARRLPVLWDRLAGSWLSTVRSFVDGDLARIIDSGSRPAGFEESACGTIDLAGALRLPVRGRFDRRMVGPDRATVGDYKISVHLADRVKVTSMLKGQSLQVPLYHLLADEAQVEILGIHPAFENRPDESQAIFPGFSDKLRGAFRETLGVVAGLAAAGVFPFHKDTHCRWCAYEQSCRRLHPPSLEREKIAPDSEPYRLTLRKNETQQPTLDAVRRKIGAGR